MHSSELVNLLSRQDGRVALVIVIEARGSAPRHPGSRMIVMADGKIIGTIGGGAVEAQAIQAAVSCIEAGTDRLFVADMLGEKALGSDPICGGSVTAVIFLVDGKRAYSVAASCLERGETVVVASLLPAPAFTASKAATATEATTTTKAIEATVLAADKVQSGRVVGANVAVFTAEGAVTYGNPGKADEASLRRALETGLPVLSDVDGRLYDPLVPRDRLLILGGGHVGQALARLAVNLDFLVCVADPRPEFVEPGRLPAEVQTRLGSFTDAIEAFRAGTSSYVVVVSPSHTSDLECVRAILRHEYRYAGFIGSRRKVRMILDQVLSDGFTAGKVEALKAPIGLEIGAETPAEIAVAILAEMIAVRRDCPSRGAEG